MLKLKMSLLAILIASVSCQNDSTKVDLKGVFPEGLALASPLHFVSATGSVTKSTSFVSHYEFSTEKIADALSGTAITDLVDARFLFANDINAHCYGPALTCENHPDDTSASSCFFPSGDLGMWLEENSDGNACAAAQLNSKMSSMEDMFANTMVISVCDK